QRIECLQIVDVVGRGVAPGHSGYEREQVGLVAELNRRQWISHPRGVPEQLAGVVRKPFARGGARSGSGVDPEHDLEAEHLRKVVYAIPFALGEDAFVGGRWRGEWFGRHVVVRLVRRGAADPQVGGSESLREESQ